MIPWSPLSVWSAGELDHLPEQAFYMKGGIDEVIAAGEELVG